MHNLWCFSTSQFLTCRQDVVTEDQDKSAMSKASNSLHKVGKGKTTRAHLNSKKVSKLHFWSDCRHCLCAYWWLLRLGCVCVSISQEWFLLSLLNSVYSTILLFLSYDTCDLFPIYSRLYIQNLCFLWAVSKITCMLCRLARAIHLYPYSKDHLSVPCIVAHCPRSNCKRDHYDLPYWTLSSALIPFVKKINTLWNFFSETIT